jgi:hypothetical protein
VNPIEQIQQNADRAYGLAKQAREDRERAERVLKQCQLKEQRLADEALRAARMLEATRVST